MLRRFQGETTHPAYSAMLEVGCAQRTIFMARWLRTRDLQQIGRRVQVWLTGP
ncbi:Tn3 family transposase [Actinomadura sp. 6N118]|uniref:Tn3 family transposase n=1 Tax=Actinomadura sp. 6N118 TaxID=3375151 RepID=UPI0037AD54C4